MIRMVEKTIPAEPAKPERTVSVECGVICDICKKESSKFGGWTFDNFGVEECTVNMRRGSNYPEGSCVTTTSFDICSDCFEDKLIPWLESHGATARKEED